MTARSNNVGLIYVREATLGQTPANSPDWKTFPVTDSESLNMENVTTASTRVTSDRGSAGTIKVGETVAGTLPSEFQSGQFDDLLESALMGAFASGVLKNASTRTSYAVQRSFNDLTNKHIVYNGVRVNGFTLSVAVRDKANISFEMVGLTSDNDNTASVVGTGSVAPISSSPIMSIEGINNVSIAGITGLCLESVSLTVTNNMEEQLCAGSPNGAAVDQLEGEFNFTGDIVVATTDDSWVLLNSKRNNDAIAISFDLSDGTNTYNFNIPSCYINFPDPSGQGQNTSVPLNISLTGAQNSTEQATLIITKS